MSFLSKLLLSVLFAGCVLLFSGCKCAEPSSAESKDVLMEISALADTVQKDGKEFILVKIKVTEEDNSEFSGRKIVSHPQIIIEPGKIGGMGFIRNDPSAAATRDTLLGKMDMEGYGLKMITICTLLPDAKADLKFAVWIRKYNGDFYFFEKHAEVPLGKEISFPFPQKPKPFVIPEPIERK